MGTAGACLPLTFEPVIKIMSLYQNLLLPLPIIPHKWNLIFFFLSFFNQKKKKTNKKTVNRIIIILIGFLFKHVFHFFYSKFYLIQMSKLDK